MRHERWNEVVRSVVEDMLSVLGRQRGRWYGQVKGEEELVLRRTLKER